MATVTKGLGSKAVRWLKPSIEPALDWIAADVEANAVGFAASHVETGDFMLSVKSTVDRTSPSHYDRLVYSDDPAAIPIEFGHTAENGREVKGLFIFTRAADAAAL